MDTKPKRKDINKYVKPHAAGQWLDIGLELEVGDEDGDELEQIKSSHSDKEACFDAMIVKWLKEAEPGQLTWRTLLGALEAYHVTDAVKAVRENVKGISGDQPSDVTAPTLTLAPDQPSLASEDVSAEEMVADIPVAGATVEPIEGSHSTTGQQHGATASEPAAPIDDGDIVRSKPTHRGPGDPPLSIDGPDLPPSSPPKDLDFNLVLRKGQEVRGYQRELARLGLEGKNYIVVAPTGSGKTLVAALVISDHLQKGKIGGEDRRVAFIVEKRPLAQQQAGEIRRYIPAAKVSCCIGDDPQASVKSSLEQGDHIVVCTAGKLFDDVRCGRLALNSFSILVFDECHHTRKKSPYSELMIRYLEMKFNKEKLDLPQVMGLTASPGAGDNRHLEEWKTIDHLVNLCARMDANSGIKTVLENKRELEEHTNKPEYTVENSQPRNEREPVILGLVKMMQELEKLVEFSSAFERWSQKYETQVQQNKFVEESSIKPEARNNIRVWELLRLLSRALDVYMELQYEDAISVLEDSKLLRRGNANEFEDELREKLSSLMASLEKFPRIENPHLKIIESILEERFTANSSTRVMLFVRTKKHVFSIQKWIEALPISSRLGIKPCAVVGQEAGITGEGMTQAEQQDAFKLFRDGQRNVLVVTSIGEEGIDVPACNLVLRYQHVSNEIAKAQTLGRARAQGSSEGVTILSAPFKQRQEAKNSELLALVDKILLDGHLPSGHILERKLIEEQKLILKKVKLEKMYSDDLKSKHNSEEVQLICRVCKAPACKGSDIRVLNDTNYIVPGEEFKTRIKTKDLSKPVVKAAMSMTETILCAKCNEHWGVSCVWPSSQGKFPMLKCECFTFVDLVQNTIIPVKKWSKAPFKIEPFEVDLDQ